MAQQPTTGFARGGWQGDAISDLIEDSEKALKGLPSKPPPGGPDPKALKDAFLETSPKFQEMLQALEVFDASVASGGPAPAKYEQALFAALRTMLRECLFTKNAGLREHHIGRVHTWFCEKRLATEQGAYSLTAPSGPAEKPLQNTWTASMAMRPSTAGHMERKKQMPSESGSTRPYTSASPTRTLSPAHSMTRGEGGEEPTGQRLKLPPSERIKEFRMRNLRISQMRRAGIPMEAIRAAEDAAKALHSAGSSGPQDAAARDEETDRAIRELWLSKREAEELERRSEQEVQDAIAVWARQRARVEEEVSRRQESVRFASQTALLHARPATGIASLDGSGALGASARSVRSPGRQLAPRSPLRDDLSIGSDESDEEGVEVVEDLAPAPPLPEKFRKVPVLRAPYDGLRQPNTPAGWPMGSHARPISARLAGQDRDALYGAGPSPRLFARAGHARPQTAGARFAPGASIAAYDETRGLPLTPAQQAVADAESQKLHGFSSPHYSRPSSALRSAQTTAPTAPDLEGSVTLRLGGSSRPVSASRAARNNELAEVDRIKRAFASARIPCALNTIERALVAPEDRTYARCVEALPRAGAHLIPDMILAEKKAAKGGKGKGKGGKKGGKKKKK
jgi:hypothetical protein